MLIRPSHELACGVTGRDDCIPSELVVSGAQQASRYAMLGRERSTVVELVSDRMAVVASYLQRHGSHSEP